MAIPQKITLTRRSFLQGGAKARSKAPAIRPPWSEEKKVGERCTSCGDCISACPQNILISDEKGKPAISFQGNECTFCGSCAEACDEDVFDVKRRPAWPLKISINAECLFNSGISCQLCTDFCAVDALRFNMRVRPVGRIDIDLDQCTGCGACLAACPTSAIQIEDGRLEAAQ